MKQFVSLLKFEWFRLDYAIMTRYKAYSFLCSRHKIQTLTLTPNFANYTIYQKLYDQHAKGLVDSLTYFKPLVKASFT